MEFERNECQRCTRMCYVCVVGTCKLCDLCFEAMCHDPETKKVMEALLSSYGEKMPQIEHD